MSTSQPIAYLTGEYPRATDTFIQREIFALRDQGIEVETCSIRKTGVEHHVGLEQQAEFEKTFYVIAAAKSPLRLIGCHLKALVKAPGRYFASLGLALRTRPAGLKGLLYQLFYFAEAAVLADHLARRNVRHLHNHIATATCTVAMLTSRVSGIPFSFTIHGPDVFFEPKHWRIDAKIEEAKFIACISDFCRSQCMVFSDPQHWDKLKIVHCGITPEKYLSQGTSERSRPHLLFIGRLAGVKGVPVLLEALSRLAPDVPDLRVTLIGDGPERGDLEARTHALGLSSVVKFAGYLSQSKVADMLSEADVLVLPSFAEGVPVTLMEAMASGLPVLATRVGGISELVEDGVSGYLVPPGNADALTARLRDLLSDADLRARMGQEGRAKVTAEFNQKTEASRLAKLINTTDQELPDER
ncbi:glycosyltransferase family 4 protein [Ruegeria profundi]|uniref:glycosyltransferase family 4 protein n=1 Tax=Ruegeria profundi TaxID=1685378 RepID=UPI003C7E89A7